MMHFSDTDPSRRAVRRPTGVGRVRPVSSDGDDEPLGAVADRDGKRREGRYDCPVCEFASDEHDEVYVHLMASHRKSTISAALLGGE